MDIDWLLKKGKPALSPLRVDCANGVGAPKLADFAKYLPNDILTIEIINGETDAAAKLNKDVSRKEFIFTRDQIELTALQKIVWRRLCQDQPTRTFGI